MHLPINIEDLLHRPFDERINIHAAFEDLQLPLIHSFLHEIESDLLKQSPNLSFVDLCRQMGIIDGDDQYIKPCNFGLLFFSHQPEKFFPYAQIDVVYFPDDEGGDRIDEHIFKGPLHEQLRGALRCIRNNYITERVIKVPDRAEARRFFNYPYDAVAATLINAVQHRDYAIREPIEVRINQDCIRIVSYPGPDPSIPLADVERGQIVTHHHRNRRIGKLLKQLNFAKCNNTGIPQMCRTLKNNGSPAPLFFTDEARSWFYTEIKIHPEFAVRDAEGAYRYCDWI